MIYWFNPEYFRLYSIHTEGVEEKQFQPHLENAQEYELVNLLGEDLKNDLEQKALAGTETPEEETLIGYCKKFLLYTVEQRLSMTLSHRPTSKGVQDHTQDDSSLSSDVNIGNIRNLLEIYVSQWREKICEYIKDNRIDFPLYDPKDCGCFTEDEGNIDVFFDWDYFYKNNRYKYND